MKVKYLGKVCISLSDKRDAFAQVIHFSVENWYQMHTRINIPQNCTKHIGF